MTVSTAVISGPSVTGTPFCGSRSDHARTPDMVHRRGRASAGLPPSGGRSSIEARGTGASTGPESHYRGPSRTSAVAPVDGCSVVVVASDPSRRSWRDEAEAASVVGGRLWGSSAQAEPLDDRAVAVDVFLLHVVQKATTLADQQEQATATVVVVLVLLEVLGQVGDAVRQQRHLDLRGAGVALAGAVLGDDLLLGLRVGTCSHAQLLS